jgi:hypothetical protein
MVLRPVYRSQENEQNMQFPYWGTGPPDQATWQTPYGAESQTTPYAGYGPAQSPPLQNDQAQSTPAGPYSAFVGEASAYYDSSHQQSAYQSGWQNPYQPLDGQLRHDNDSAYQAPPYQIPKGPYAYGHPSTDTQGAQCFFTSGDHYETPAIKYEEQANATVQQNPSYQDACYSVPPLTRNNEGYEPILGQAPFTDHDQAFEQDRGVMGAIAGAAAGGYAGWYLLCVDDSLTDRPLGHKVHHGFLGALGGAYVGHKLEDVYNDREKQPQAAYQAPPACVPQVPVQNQPPRRGNFSVSSRDITLDKDYDLIASCKDVKGHKRLSAISLNNVLTNEDGRFKWVTPGSGSGNFAASARHVKLIDGGKALEAELRRMNGQWRKDVVRLDERIENADGELKMT